MRKSVVLIAIITSFFSLRLSAAQQPKLVVQIIVSQMRYDYLKRFEHNFSKKGFYAFTSEGITCTNARYNYSNTTSEAGISTIMSGANPSLHGILSQNWVDFTTNGEIGVIDDKKYFGVGCVETDGQFAPTRMTVSSTGDEIKRSNRLSRVVSLALEPVSAVLGGGILADAAYWFDIYRGNWSTSTYYTQRLPAWVVQYNEEKFADLYNGRLWNPFITATDYVYTNGKDINTLRKTATIFSVKDLFKPKATGNYAALRVTPAGTDMLFEMAKRTIIYESLGKDDAPDLLVITVDPTRAVSETYGTESMELEDAYYRLDANIGSLLDCITAQTGKENALVVITSDHGSSDTARENGKMPSGIFNVVQFKVLMNGFLNAQYGQDEWITSYNNRSLYINRKIAFEKKLNITDIQNNAASFAMQFRGVAQAVTASSLQGNHFAGGPLEKIQNGFYPKHSGDIVINLLPGWIEDTDGKLSASGSMYEYDTHVPLLWYGAGLRKAQIDTPVDMTDIAPTVSHILRINQPDAATGKSIVRISSEF